MRDRRTIILVGGGAKGSIGEVIGDHLLAGMEPYRLVVLDKHHTSELLHPTDITFVDCDLTNPASIRQAAYQAVRTIDHQQGILSGVVYAAGTNHLGSVDSLQEEDFDNMVDVNAKGVWLLTKFLRAAILANRYGIVLNRVKTLVLGSNTAFVAKTRSFGYAFSKAGMVHMLRCMHRELAPGGWEFTSLDFGIVMDSAMTDKTVRELQEQRGWGREETAQMLLRNVPNGRPVSREEIAQTVLFLLRPEINTFGGSSIRFDGGQQQG